MLFESFIVVIITLPSSFALFSKSILNLNSNSSSLVFSPRDSNGWGWGGESSSTGAHSFFDIALTALAFLSFGIFLLNLLMNALFLTTTQGLTSTGPILTNTGGATAGAGTGGATTPAGLIYIRRKRAALELSVDPLTALNALSKTVLNSIDAMIEKHECLPMILCNGNRQAQVIGHGFQYIMPLFSVSTSYIGEKRGYHQNFPEHLDAILHGVSESNCQSYFTHFH